MPYFAGAGGKVYYRDWNVEDPIAGIVFGHGFGEHSGLFHRFAFRLNSYRIRVWGIDAIGHGLSDGDRGKPRIGDLAANMAALASIATDMAPGLPLIAAGHSMGSIAAALALVREPNRYRGAVLTGSPIDSFDITVLDQLEGVTMSRDPFYLDQLQYDPLQQWTHEAPPPSADALVAEDEIWRSLGNLDRPILFVNGEDDPIAPPSMGRRAATKCRIARFVEIAGGCHDIINDSPHALVTDAIATFVKQVIA